MNYIELPIIAKYNLFFKKYSLINVFIGAYGAFWINGVNHSLDYRTGSKTTKVIDFNKSEYEYERIDAGIIVGVSYESRSNNNYIIDFRYSHGRIGSSRMDTDALLNRCFTISYTYLIDVSK